MTSTRTTYVHVGGYVSGFTDGRQRYAVTTTRADGESIRPSELDNAKRANIRAARRLTAWNPRDVATRGVRTAVKVGSFTVAGDAYAAVESINRND
jgi:hypothetical protein